MKENNRFMMDLIGSYLVEDRKKYIASTKCRKQIDSFKKQELLINKIISCRKDQCKKEGKTLIVE